MGSPERVEQINVREDGEERKKVASPVFDIKTGKKLTAEEIEKRKNEHPTWSVSINLDGSVNGLPSGISINDIVLFLGNDGKWYAQNPSRELLEEMRMW